MKEREIERGKKGETELEREKERKRKKKGRRQGTRNIR